MERGHSSCTGRIAVPVRIEPTMISQPGALLHAEIVSSLLLRQAPVTLFSGFLIQQQ